MIPEATLFYFFFSINNLDHSFTNVKTYSGYRSTAVYFEGIRMKVLLFICWLLMVLVSYGVDGNLLPPLVTIPLGKISGSLMISSSGRPFLSFRGIPFAQPPIGDLRFKVYRCQENELIGQMFFFSPFLVNTGRLINSLTLAFLNNSQTVNQSRLCL